MKRSLLLITKYALLGALICALVVMTQLIMEWAIFLPEFSQEKTITTPGQLISFLWELQLFKVSNRLI